MNIRQLPARIEVTFWLTAINLMSESLLLQRILRTVYQLKLNLEKEDTYRWILISSAAGLLVGLILGLITS